MQTDMLFHFIKERHAIFVSREIGKPKPWTEDKILQSYRFCNVYRELDTVTQWIAENWRGPYGGDRHIWFAMVVARLVNWPDTLQELTPVIFGKQRQRVGWDPDKFVKVMQARKARGEKVFSGAYIVSTNGHTMDKSAYLAEQVLTPLWEAKTKLAPNCNGALSDWHAQLTQYNGMGSFMAAQVVADVKYAAPYLHQAPDWWTFAASGPGSRRGLNRVLGRPVDAPWKENEWRAALAELQKVVDPHVKKLGYPRLHAQDLQNCLCELDKYERVRLGEGRPRSLYPGV